MPPPAQRVVLSRVRLSTRPFLVWGRQIRNNLAAWSWHTPLRKEFGTGTRSTETEKGDSRYEGCLVKAVKRWEMGRGRMEIPEHCMYLYGEHGGQLEWLSLEMSDRP